MSDDAGIFILGIILGALVVGIGVFHGMNEVIAERCQKSGEIVIDNQRYTCSPTGEWVDGE